MVTGLIPPTGGGTYPNVPKEMPRTFPNIWGEEEVTGTPTPPQYPSQASGAVRPATPSIDMAQMYLEWAASNPNATQEQAFAAGADIALGQNQPIGLGQTDEFQELSPFDRVVNVEDQVDTFPELQPQVDTFGEGTINKGSWRDTVIDISDVQGPQG